MKTMFRLFLAIIAISIALGMAQPFPPIDATVLSVALIAVVVILIVLVSYGE